MTVHPKGLAGEDLAVRWLRRSGYRIVARNFRCPRGEVDVIGEHRGTLCFIEVKSRNSLALGYPEEAVDQRKRGKIARTAAAFLQQHPHLADLPCRFDVVSISPLGITIIANAFQDPDFS